MRGKVLDDFLTVEEYLDKKVVNITDIEIAGSLGYSEETLRRWKRINNITNLQIAKFKYERIVYLQSRGLCIKSITRSMRMHPKTISNIINSFT